MNCNNECGDCTKYSSCKSYNSPHYNRECKENINASYPGLVSSIQEERFADAYSVIRSEQRRDNLCVSISVLVLSCAFSILFLFSETSSALSAIKLGVISAVVSELVFWFAFMFLFSLAFRRTTYGGLYKTIRSVSDKFRGLFKLFLYAVVVLVFVSFSYFYFYFVLSGGSHAASEQDAYDEGYKLGFDHGYEFYISDDPLSMYAGNHETDFLEGYIVGCRDGHNDFYDYLLSEE